MSHGDHWSEPARCNFCGQERSTHDDGTCNAARRHPQFVTVLPEPEIEKILCPVCGKDFEQSASTAIHLMDKHHWAYYDAQFWLKHYEEGLTSNHETF